MVKSKKSAPIIFSRILGICLLLAAAAITISISCPTNPQLFIIYAFIGLGIASLLLKSADRTMVLYKQWNIKIFLGGGVALPCILFFTDPVGKFKPDNCNKKQSVTVFVHGKKGKQDVVLRQQGYVVMDIGSERKRAPISENGEAYFQNLELSEKVHLNIDFSEPYRSIYPDSVYTIDKSGKIYLAVALQGINKVDGRVLYDDKPLADVLVKIDKLSTSTDSTGQFLFEIPDSLQKKQYTVWFFKNGFKAISKKAYPQTDIPLSVVMEK